LSSGYFFNLFFKNEKDEKIVLCIFLMGGCIKLSAQKPGVVVSDKEGGHNKCQK
jgi:hypothetical protein